MKYAAYREWTGIPFPAQFRHGDVFIDGSVVFITPNDGYKFICADCGFIMRGGNPANCPACGKRDLILAEDNGP